MRPIGRMKNRRRGGFSLLELLLVVAIIALLAAFVVPQFMGTQRGVEIDICRTMVSRGGNLASQIELFRMAMGRYPTELRELVERPDDEDERGKWRGPYIDDLARLRDPWGNELQYRYPGTRNEDSYDLWSYGPDGRDGTEDDIGNWRTER